MRHRLVVVFVTLAVCLPTYATTFYVAPSGSDKATGSKNDPLGTIAAAAAKAMPGDVVLVLEGTYRERVAPPRGGLEGKPIIYRGEPGKRVFIKGSEIWAPAWRSEGDGIYSAIPAESIFDDQSPEYLDGHNPLKVELSSTPWRRQGRREAERRKAGDKRIGRCDERIVYTCGQLFVNSKPFKEVPLRAELQAGTWWYEADTQRVWVNFGTADPVDQLVELTTRRRLFAPKQRGLGYIIVEGFVFEHCGNQYPTNFWKVDKYAQKGAIGTEAGHHWIIRNNVIRYAKTFAIDVGRVDRHNAPSSTHHNLVERNYLIDNGAAGILSNGSEHLVIRDNVLLRNNYLRFFGIKRWEQAGIKAHSFRNGLIEHNYIAHNYDMSGVWLDNQFPQCRVSRNVISNNGTRGIFLEMSDYDFDSLLIDNNVIISNAENAVYIHDASGATFLNNLMAGTRNRNDYGQAVYIRQVDARTRTYHHSFFNNLMLDNPANVEVNYPAARSGPQKFDSNVYGVKEAARAFAINRRSDSPSPWASDEFKRLILADLGYKKEVAAIIFDQYRANLDIGEWRAFWRHHRLENDASSTFSPNSRVTYDEDELLLTVALDVDPRQSFNGHVPVSDTDFYGQTRTTVESKVAGPFSTLKQGNNKFTIWSGLPLVAEGELPPSNWTK